MPFSNGFGQPQMQTASGSGTTADPYIPSVAIAAGSAVVGQVTAPSDVLPVTLSLDTNIYASGDVLADTQVVTGAFRVADGRAILQSLMLIDQDDQKADCTIYFLSSNVTMGTENSAPSISDANAVNILGYVDIAVADYKDLGGVSVVNKNNIGIVLESASGVADCYVAVVNGTSTPTYTASGVKLRLGLLQD